MTFLATGALFFATWLPGTSPSDLTALISALRARQFATALTLAAQLRAQNPSDPRLWTLEGMANEGLQKKSEAINDYRSALHLDPNYLPALKAAAQLHYAAGDPDAQALLRRILVLDPTDQVTHAMLAALAYQAKNCPEVISQYGQGRSIMSQNPDALSQFGECLLGSNDLTGAETALARAVELDGNRWQLRYNLAAVQMTRHQPEAALATLGPLLPAPDVAPPVLSLAALAYEARGDTPRAVELARQAIVRDRKNEKFYLQFADLCFDHQSFQVGVDMLNAGLSQLPGSANLHLARGILWGQLGDFTRAENDFDQADRLDGSGSLSGAAASLAELQNSNLPNALKIARDRLQRDPQNSLLHYVKAATLKQMGVEPGSAGFGEALAAAAEAVRLQPNFPAARNLLGSLYLQANQLAPATAQFRAVLKDDPADQTALYHLIQVCRKADQPQQIPALLKQLAQAKIIGRERDQMKAQYRLFEVGKQSPDRP